jgi:predicted PurR-regulated permease PerM
MSQKPTKEVAEDSRDAFVETLPPDVVRIAATLVSAAVIICALYFGRDVLIPLACAFLISFALHPLVSCMVHIGMPRIAAVIAVMAMILVMLAALVLVLGAQVRSLSQEVPTYQSTIRAKIEDLRSSFKVPTGLDRALEAVKDKKDSEAPSAPTAPQRVEIVPRPQQPIETAAEWLVPSLQPLATAGIVFVFVFLALLDRSDLRNRLLRLLGGNLHRSTDAIEEAGSRISKYLLMQLIVNVSYAIPMAIGLWLIGVPGAMLWGAVAAIMRFVPYVGPLISAVFPIALAFAVDPGWSMVLWTIGLILVLEVVSNNIVEPVLYGTSTGLSALSLITAAIFWTALWGPVGLILSTPLTVCLLVIGKNIPQLRFFDTLLGSMPALDTPTRIYQRLIADDADEAIDIATKEIAKTSVRAFYHDTGIPVLRLANDDYLRHATPEHRLRVANGMEEMLDDLQEEFAPAVEAITRAPVLCVGGKWEMDTIAAEMLAHALALEGIQSRTQAVSTLGTKKLAELDVQNGDVVCLSYFSANPIVPARHLCRRLRRRWPDLRIVLALWDAPANLLDEKALQELGAEAVVVSVDEAIHRIQRMVSPEEAETAQQPAVPENESERVEALHATGILSGNAREELDAIALRAADVFNVDFAVISAIDADQEFIIGQSRKLPGTPGAEENDMLVIPRDEAVCDYVVATGEPLVIADTERDPRFTDNPTIKKWNARFYAGAPLRSADGHVFGAMCILGKEPRTLDEDEMKVLATIAADVVAEITGIDRGGEEEEEPDSGSASATVGQPVPE